MKDKIIIKGARGTQFKNIDVEIPRDQLVVITGLSGSANRPWLLIQSMLRARGVTWSLCQLMRQFLGQMDKPDVDYIEGLSPACSIDQKTTGENPRSTGRHRHERFTTAVALCPEWEGPIALNVENLLASKQ